MKFKVSGKRSKAWWLQAIKWFGNEGVRGIMRGAVVPTWQIPPAIEQLKFDGLVSVEGKEGRGRRPKYHLTAAGERYLNDNQEELKEPVDPPPKPAAEKQDPKPDKYAVVFINGRPAFKKGQRLIARKYVPLAELDRLDKEINAVRNRTDSTTPTFKPQPMAQLKQAYIIKCQRAPKNGMVLKSRRSAPRYYVAGRQKLRMSSFIAECQRARILANTIIPTR
jgi:hypothetical protein